MESIAKKEPQVSDEDEIKAVQILLPERLWRRVKVAAAENGWSLRELVKSALEQYLDAKGKAA